MNVGVRELKQRLSDYLDRAARGERIVVTHRGRPHAVIGPLPGGDHVRQGVEEGWITPPELHAPLPPPPRRVRAAATVQEMMEEDRGR